MSRNFESRQNLYTNFGLRSGDALNGDSALTRTGNLLLRRPLQSDFCLSRKS
jgi:hypothetical protein